MNSEAETKKIDAGVEREKCSGHAGDRRLANRQQRETFAAEDI